MFVFVFFCCLYYLLHDVHLDIHESLISHPFSQKWLQRNRPQLRILKETIHHCKTPMQRKKWRKTCDIKMKGRFVIALLTHHFVPPVRVWFCCCCCSYFFFILLGFQKETSHQKRQKRANIENKAIPEIRMDLCQTKVKARGTEGRKGEEPINVFVSIGNRTKN